jgi:glycosyltransferase involved in cell wall biosynthesis
MELMSLRGHEIMVIGFDQFWKDEKGGFISERIEVNDVCRFNEGAKVKFIRPTFIKFPILDYISFLFSSRREIQKQVKEFDPDVIIGFSAVLSNYWGMVFANKNKIPYVYYWYDIVHVLNVPKPFGPLAKIIEKRIIKNSDKIIVINEVLKDYIINFGADKEITEVVPGGVDLEKFNPNKIDSKYFRNKYNISDNDLVLFFMGWLYHFSGLKEVVTELNKVKKTHPHIKLMIVGWGDAKSELKTLIKNFKLEDTVIMTGQMPYEDIPQLIASADICLLPAYNNEIMRDIVPIKIYEYLAMHKPVIATKLPGVMKEFGENNGIIYVDKSEDVINKVIDLDENEIETYKLKARIFIEACNWDNIIKRFETTLNSLIDERKMKLD